MKWIFSLLLVVIVAYPFGATPVQAGSGFYISSELGANFASGVDQFGRDDDRASMCDEYINPYFMQVPGCTDPDRGVDASKTVFDRAEGILAGAAVGYRLQDVYPDRLWGGFRFELEYFFRESEYDQVTSRVPTRAQTVAKQQGEIALAERRLGSITSHNLFGKPVFRFDQHQPVHPLCRVRRRRRVYGLGLGGITARYPNPDEITSIPANLCDSISDSACDANLIRRNLAGTATTEQTVLRDTLFGYQVLFGVDYALTETVTLGVKGRWTKFNTFRDGDSWDRLRSHESNLRRNGSEPVTYRFKTDDIEFFGLSLNLKYHF